jgi:ankyrin repeat protein
VAAHDNWIAEVQRLLRGGVNVNEPDGRGFTALHVAAQAGDAQMVTFLIGAPGVRVNARSSGGSSALLLASGPAPTASGAAVVALLLQVPAIDVNCSGPQGESPLFLAAQAGNARVVQLLLGAPQVSTRRCRTGARRCSWRPTTATRQ